jgi:hypothetical protein
MIRNAKNVDIPAIVRLLQEGYSRTHYAKSGIVKIDVLEAKRLLVNSIQRHDYKGMGACWVQVAENDGQITGLVLGTFHRIYSIGDMLMATDLFWTTTEGSAITDARDLMKGMIEWAWRSPHCAEVKCGTTAIINGDPGAAGRILERLGLALYGNLYRMERAECLAQQAA